MKFPIQEAVAATTRHRLRNMLTALRKVYPMTGLRHQHQLSIKMIAQKPLRNRAASSRFSSIGHLQMGESCQFCDAQGDYSRPTKLEVMLSAGNLSQAILLTLSLQNGHNGSNSPCIPCRPSHPILLQTAVNGKHEGFGCIIIGQCNAAAAAVQADTP